MRVNRDFPEPIARWLETAPLSVISDFLKTASSSKTESDIPVVQDDELVAAIAHSVEHDDPDDFQTASEFLADIRKEGLIR